MAWKDSFYQNRETFDKNSQKTFDLADSVSPFNK